jgi:DNA repair exonuclease SbcCD ATPase subunit/predicted phosphodiesterase
MRFAHIADTHIRNLKYHKEYRAVFSQLYENLREQKPDYIVHCGDIAHTKTQISPEYVEMCSDFLKSLADIAPTYVILGNHDGNLRNSSRQDALTPIVKALEHPSLHLMRNAGETRLEGGFTLNVLSVFDEDNWVQPTDEKRINIALYHGSISRCQTDLGWTMERGENDIGVFDNFDYGFLGDIHKTNQILDERGKIRYPGSTVQQNHGETNDKGYLLWDIEDKESFACEHFILDNPKPFITIRLTPAGRLPKNIDIPTAARVRLLSENHLSLDVIRRAIDVTKTRFKPEAITYLNRASGNRVDIDELTKSLIKEDLRDITVQEDLIGKYLQEYQVDEKTVEKIFGINRVYKTKVEEQEEISRNVNWRLKKVEWDNLFNYGEKNSIDFENLNGIVGIFGKNFSGKSSIIDSLLYTLFNTTSKNNRKNLNIINQNRDHCRGYVEIDIAEKTYKIERISTKYQKKLHGNITIEAKTDLNFTVYDNALCEEESLNGTSRNETDKNIKKIFGSLEDFLLTSMASQLGSLSYIGEGSTRRKEILAKFLDLEVFERKFRMAKEDASDAKALLKRDESRIFDEELQEAQLKYNENEICLASKEEECQGLKVELEQRQESLREITENLKELPDEVIDIVQVTSNIKDLKNKLKSCENFRRGVSSQMEGKEEYITMTEKFISKLNIEEAKEKQKEIEDKTLELRSFEEELEKLLEDLERKNKKTSLLSEVPCGDKFPNCRFIEDAHTAKNSTKIARVEIDNLKIDRSNITDNIEELNPGEVSNHIQEYENLWQKLTEAKNGLNLIQLELEKNKNEIFKTKNDLSTLQRQEEYYDENKDLIENYDKLCTRQKKIQSEVNKKTKRHDICQKEILELYKENGTLEERTEKIKRDKEEYLSFQDDFSAYDLYMRCMHSNGISYDIIKKRLPLINSEVAKVLANIVDFEIFFENDDNRLDILIKHPGYDPRPIEMGSGAEKTIAAMAIRLALLNVSTLPKGDIFVLDEPGTSLDEDNMEGFIRILDMIKTQFKTVLLVSHLDSLKDTVDTQIMIEKKKGYAFVKQ